MHRRNTNTRTHRDFERADGGMRVMTVSFYRPSYTLHIESFEVNIKRCCTELHDTSSRLLFWSQALVACICLIRFFFRGDTETHEDKHHEMFKRPKCYYITKVHNPKLECNEKFPLEKGFKACKWESLSALFKAPLFKLQDRMKRMMFRRKRKKAPMKTKSLLQLSVAFYHLVQRNSVFRLRTFEPNQVKSFDEKWVSLSFDLTSTVSSSVRISCKYILHAHRFVAEAFCYFTGLGVCKFQWCFCVFVCKISRRPGSIKINLMW